jgi:hypothetical protein
LKGGYDGNVEGLRVRISTMSRNYMQEMKLVFAIAQCSPPLRVNVDLNSKNHACPIRAHAKPCAPRPLPSHPPSNASLTSSKHRYLFRRTNRHASFSLAVVVLVSCPRHRICAHPNQSIISHRPYIFASMASSVDLFSCNCI